MPLRRLLLAPACLLLAACGAAQQPSGAVSTATGVPTSAPTSAPGCVTKAAARDIWTWINNRLNAIALDPKHQGLSDVATGTALSDIQSYIQTTLVAKNLTEREVDTLDSLTVTDAACTGNSLQLTVASTVKQDDYLKPDGSVDHADSAVGTQLHLVETFDRVNGVWKESSIGDAGGTSPSPQVV